MRTSRTPPARPVETEPVVTISLEPDSWECPRCGVVVVPTDSRAAGCEGQHTCT